MNDVQKVIKFNEVKKNPPSSFNGKCPVCGDTAIRLTFEEGTSDVYNEKKDTAELYFNCENCTAEFTVVFSFKRIFVERIFTNNGKTIKEVTKWHVGNAL